MEDRRRFSTHTPSEERVGYSRAVESKDGKRLYISGTTSVDEEGKTQGRTVYEQTDCIFRKIKGVIRAAGYSDSDVVLLTAYVTQIHKIGEFDQAFIEHFSDVQPACTLVGISELVVPDLFVEIACIADRG